MAAYMNKNTFSSGTALPPEENRLYIGSNLSKNRLPLWQKEGEQGEPRRAPGEGVEKDQFLKEQAMGMKELPPETEQFSKCKKCGHGKHLTKKTRRSFRLPVHEHRQVRHRGRS